MSKISRVHYITQGTILGYSHAQLAEEVCMGGADWVQLRVKKTGAAEWKAIAEDTLSVCRKYNTKLIINDNVRIAKEIKAEGVHLGKEDTNPREARKLLGSEFIIGATANTFIDIEKHAEAGVDYIGLGPFRFTNTKDNLSPILGLEGYNQIIDACIKAGITIPIIAIGGIQEADLSNLFSTGIHGVAISSVINNEIDKELAIKKFMKRVNECVNPN